MANINDILIAPEHGWRRVLFTEFDDINFYMYKNYSKNYKDFLTTDGVHIFHEDISVTYFEFSNISYATKWRIIGKSVSDEISLFNLPPENSVQLNNIINTNTEKLLLMEGYFAVESGSYYGKDFRCEVEYSTTDFILYAIDFYEGIVAKGTPNEGINGTLANGLLAHYSFNDGSLADISGNGYDLSAVGTVYDVADKDGQSVQAKENFDTGHYLQCKSKSLVNGTKNAISIWAYIPDLTQTGSFFSIGDSASTSSPLLLLQQNTNTLRVYAYGYYSSPITITTGWHHFLYNDNKLYIDGVLKIQRSSFKIGAFLYLFVGYPQGLVCKIDEVRVYNRLLTGDKTTIGETATGEIAEIFTMGVNYEVDIEPPTFNTIDLSNITSDSFSLNINCSENATAYYKLLNIGNTAPTSAELKTTHDAEIVLTANILSTINTAGLSPNTDYDLYVVAEDKAGNLQVIPSKISFATTADKITDLDFNIDFDLIHPSDTINLKYMDIKSNGVSISNKNPTIKYWTDNNSDIKVFDKNGENFSGTTTLYFQVECDGYEPSDVFIKQLNVIYIRGFQDGYHGLINYCNHNNDNYKKSSSMILVPLSRNSFLSPK